MDKMALVLRRLEMVQWAMDEAGGIRNGSH